MFEQNCPGEKEDGFDVEQNKKDGDQIEFDRKTLVRGNNRTLPAFEGLHLIGKLPLGTEKGGHHDHANGDADCQ